MNLAGWALIVAMLSAAAGSGAAALLDLHESAASVQELGTTRRLAVTCMRRAAAARR
jgi:hypothetical protein